METPDMRPERERGPGVGSPDLVTDDQLTAPAGSTISHRPDVEDVVSDAFTARVLRGEWQQLGLVLPTDGEGSDCD